MEFVILALIAFGATGIWLLVRTGRKQNKAESNSAQILDATFDGSADVTFHINMTTLKYETVVLGAKARGYRLASQADNQYGPHTLMFEKVA